MTLGSDNRSFVMLNTARQGPHWLQDTSPNDSSQTGTTLTTDISPNDSSDTLHCVWYVHLRVTWCTMRCTAITKKCHTCFTVWRRILTIWFIPFIGDNIIRTDSSLLKLLDLQNLIPGEWREVWIVHRRKAWNVGFKHVHRGKVSVQ